MTNMAMITPSSSSSSSSGAPGAQRDREALEALVRLGFCDAAKVVAGQGHERVLAAVAYARSRRNVRKRGAYVRRLLNDACIPAPLVWADEDSDGWHDWRSLDGHEPAVWDGEPEEAALLLWNDALALLERQVTRPNFDTWLRPTIGLALRDGELVVGAAGAFAEEWLRTKLCPIMSRTVSGLLNKPTEVVIVAFEGGNDGEASRAGMYGEHRDGQPGPE